MPGLKSVKIHGRTFDASRTEPDVNKSDFNLKIICISGLKTYLSFRQLLVLCGLPVANYKKNYERSQKLPTPTRSNVANWIF